MTTNRQIQDIFIEGLEQSLAMALAAYGRLAAIAYQSAEGEDQTRVPLDTRLYVTLMLLDAWSIVDSVNRLRLLIENTRNLKQTPAVTSLLKSTEVALTLRNYVQHLNETALIVAMTAEPVWGSLSWVRATPLDIAKNQVLISGVIPALQRDTPVEVPIVNPAGKMIKSAVDRITLAAAGTEVNLSQMVENVALFKNRFGKAMLHRQAELSGDEAPLIEIEL